MIKRSEGFWAVEKELGESDGESMYDIGYVNGNADKVMGRDELRVVPDPLSPGYARGYHDGYNKVGEKG